MELAPINHEHAELSLKAQECKERSRQYQFIGQNLTNKDRGRKYMRAAAWMLLRAIDYSKFAQAALEKSQCCA